MKADTIHYNHQTGIVTAEPYPGGEKFTVTDDAVDLRLRAGDDVSVRIDQQQVHVTTLVDEPLLIRNRVDGTVEVRTARQPEADADSPAAKR